MSNIFFQNTYVRGFLQLFLGIAIILFNDPFAPSTMWFLHIKPVLPLGTSVLFFGLAQIVFPKYAQLAKYISLLAVVTAVMVVFLFLGNVLNSAI